MGVRQSGGRGARRILGELGLLISNRVRHTIPPWWCPEIADNRHRAKLPENQSNIALSGQNGKLINGSAATINVRNKNQ